MIQPAGEAKSHALQLDFDRRLNIEFHGSSVTSDSGLLCCRELDDAFDLMAIADRHLVDSRTGGNGRHDLVGMLRQSLFGRFSGYGHRRPWRRTERGKCLVSTKEVRSKGER